MPTQQQIAAHLDLNQSQVSRHLGTFGIDWKTASMDQLRVAYLRHLRAMAAEYMTKDGDSLTGERLLTERVDRELKQLALDEKKSALINVSQFDQELRNMVAAFRTELLARDDKLAADLATLYGVQVDVAILNEFTNAALAQFGRYAPAPL